MIEGWDFAAASVLGARQRQEDDWGTHVNPPAEEDGACLLAAVADGMGGMPAGDRASSVAIRTFLDSYLAIRLPARERLRHALGHANREVGIAVEANPELTGMGCTLVAVLFFRDRCEWLSVGDSFILRYHAGALERVNPLHIYANELEEEVKRGEISVDAALNHPDRSALTSAVQGTVLERVAQGELHLEPGDVVVLASDGIATLTEEEIASICTEHAEAGAGRIAETIIERIGVRERPGQDNATAIVVSQKDDLIDTRVIRDPKGIESADWVDDHRSQSDADSNASQGQREVFARVETQCPLSSVTEPSTRESTRTVRFTTSNALLAGSAFVLGVLSSIGAWYAISLM